MQRWADAGFLVNGDPSVSGERPLPQVVVAADWSARASHRWMARASLGRDKRYDIDVPEPVGDPTSLLRRAGAAAGRDGAALVAFDFPIGLPAAYAQRAQVDSFRTVLPQLGSGVWESFYDVTDAPGIHRPFGPHGNAKGGLTRDQLAQALGLSSARDLLRGCDGRTATRGTAEVIFFTRFPKQVGRATVHGWKHVLGPGAGEIRIWPFDGRLADLLRPPGVVVAEMYPAEACAHLGLAIGSRAGASKTDPAARRRAVSRLWAVTESAGIRWSPAAREAALAGFASDDAFDAVVGLVSVLQVVLGLRPDGAPPLARVHSVEGWILGQAAPTSIGATRSGPSP